MKILCLDRPLPGATFEKYQPHLQDEVRHVWQAYKNGIVRETYSRQDRSGVAIILECTSVDEAKEAFADFPLVRAGLIEIDAIPLGPFLNWEMLFSPAAEARATEKHCGAKPMLDTEHEMNRLTVATYVKKRVPFIALVLAASLIIATVADGTFRAVNASTPNPKQTSSEKAQNMKIKINIGGKTLTAILADNATARDFASVLPLTVSMKDLFGREKYGDLPKALSENGPRNNRYEVGEIAYWSPDRQFAIYYRQDGETIPSPGIIPIAKIGAGTEVFNVPGSVKVMIEIAK